MRYVVKYDGIEIGLYNVISNNCVEYTVIEEGLQKVKEKGYDLLPMLTKDYSGKAFPFFDNRIRNCKRFEGKKIGYHTDSVELEEMS